MWKMEAEDLAMPDELLLHIFSFVDAVTLLDAVPLVCRQWRRVARDPAAWRSVSVNFEMEHRLYKEEEKRVRAVARVLLHAPALGSVHLDDYRTRRYWLGPRRFALRRVYLLPALRRSQAIVRELHLACILDEDLPVVLGLLWRCRHVIRAVSLGARAPRAPRDTSRENGIQEWPLHSALPAGDQLTVLGMLLGLQRLEELQVVLDLRSAWLGPGDLTLPHLRRLSLCVEDADRGLRKSLDLSTTVAVRLVRSRADALQHLHLEFGSCIALAGERLLCHAMQLDRCASLRSLSIPLTVLATFERDVLDRLQTLCLDMESLGPSLRLEQRLRGYDDHGIQDLLEWLQRGEEPLRRLRAFELKCPWDPRESSATHQQTVHDFFVGLARLAANATVLRVSVCAKTGDRGHENPLIELVLPVLVDGMPDLRDVRLDGEVWFHGDLWDIVAPRLLGLRDLHLISGRVLVLDAGEAEEAEEAMATFRRHRPDVHTAGLVFRLLKDYLAENCLYFMRPVQTDTPDE